MKIVNCGCGNKYDSRMINLDYVPADSSIVKCDITKGLPFENGSVDWIYNSHFLEHLSYNDALGFLKECARVIKQGGGLRIVVPDLEDACRSYLNTLEKAKAGLVNDSRYEYSVIELLDQMTRVSTGGKMMEYWFSGNADLEFLKERHEASVVKLVSDSLNKEANSKSVSNSYIRLLINHPIIFLKKAINYVTRRLFSKWRYYQIIQQGKLQLSGEKHKWMYDSYGLELLLKKAGFTNVSVKECTKSDIPDFENMKLEINDDGSEYKPHSIYLEALK